MRRAAGAIIALATLTYSAAAAPPVGASGASAVVTLVAAPDGAGDTCSAVRPCTVNEARTLIHQHADWRARGVTVYLRGGVYRLAAPLSLGPDDSGAPGHPVVWTAFPGERPVFSGAIRVTGFHRYDAATNTWRARVPTGLTGSQLSVDGVRADRTRSALDPSGFTKTATGFTTTDASYLAWTNPASVQIVARNAWKQLRCPLASITPAAGGGSDLNVAEPCWQNAGTSPTPGFPFNGSGAIGIDTISWLENAYALLHQPGQFYLDRTAGYLYYIPRPGQNLARADVELPVTQQLVTLTGTPGHLTPLNDDAPGITYTGTSWGVSPGRSTGDLDGDVHYATTDGDSASFAFTGAGIDVLSETYSDEGAIAVYVDGRYDETVNTVSTVRLAQQDIVSIHGLPAGRHTVQLVKAGGTYMLVDGYVVQPGPVTPVHDISLRGITFTGATWDQPSEPAGYADNQAGVLWQQDGASARPEVAPGAVQVTRGLRIDISGDEFTGLGGVAVRLADGTQDTNVTGDAIHDVSGGGVYVGEVDDYWLTDPTEMTTGDTVADNAIHDIGVEYEDQVGVFVGYSRGVTIAHNEIADTPYSGISLGWGWGWASDGVTQHGTNYAEGNRITGNYIHDVMRVLNDGGPIYTLGGQGDGTVRSICADNVVSKAGGTFGNAQGIYHDEGSSWWDTHDNVVSQMGQYWTMEWTSTIHDITIHDDYTDDAAARDNGTDVTITNTTVVPDGSWPPAARAIVAASGLQGTYKDLMPREPYLLNDGEYGDLLAPASFSYTPGWGDATIRPYGDLNADVHYATANGEAATLTFTGTGANILGEKAPDQGTIEVYLDGRDVGQIDTTSAARMVQQTIYQIHGLRYGTHTLRLAKISGPYATVDGAIVTVRIATPSCSRSTS